MFEKSLNVIKNFFKTRGVGFYLTVAAVILALVQLIIYSVAFNDILYVQYRSTTAIVCSSLAIVLGVLFSCTMWTERCAPAAVALLELLAFLFFIRDGYWYFTTQFFAGVTWTAIVTTYYGYLVSIVMFVVILVLSVASMYIRQSKAGKEELSTEKEVAV